jgi:hypothetical protein
MKIVLIAFIGLIVSGAARAADLSAVAGHYRYEQYVVTLPDGRVLHLKDLGASEAFLDVSDAGITLRMTMTAGNTVTQSARVLEAHFEKGAGYWKPYSSGWAGSDEKPGFQRKLHLRLNS